jgi:hypothetical protein
MNPAAEKLQHIAVHETATRLKWRAIDLQGSIPTDRLDKRHPVEQVEQRDRFAPRTRQAQLTIIACANTQWQFGSVETPFALYIPDN